MAGLTGKIGGMAGSENPIVDPPLPWPIYLINSVDKSKILCFSEFVPVSRGCETCRKLRAPNNEGGSPRRKKHPCYWRKYLAKQINSKNE